MSSGVQFEATVLVAARPRAEAEQRTRRRRRGVRLGEQPLQLLVHRAGGVLQDVVEEEEDPPDLVDHPRALRAHRVGLPQDRDRLQEALGGVAALPGRPVGLVELLQAGVHHDVLVQDVLARDLRRVRRGHQLDGHAVEHLLHPLGRHAARRHGLTAAARLSGCARLRLPLGVALPAAPHAVVLLGRVDELEVDREGADDAGLEGHVEAVDDPLDLGFPRLGLRPVGVGAERPVQEPEALLDVQQLPPALLHQHPPEEVPEQADVTAEGLVPVVVAAGAATRGG